MMILKLFNQDGPLWTDLIRAHDSLPGQARTIAYEIYCRYCNNSGVDKGHSFEVDTNGVLTYTPVGKESRQVVKPGKMVKMICGDTFADYEIEQFVTSFKTIFCSQGQYGIRVVSGSEIRKSYKTHNYYQGDNFARSGDLWSSCMNNCGDYLDMYVKNPDVCRLATLTYTDESGDTGIVARGLIWETTCGKTLLDRVYSVHPIHKEKMLRYADENGYWTRLDRGEYYAPNKRSGSYIDINLSVQLSQWEFDKYPYVDTFRDLSDDGVAYDQSQLKIDTRLLDSTCGGYEGRDDDDDDTWSEYLYEYIPNDEAVYSIVASSYIRRNDAVEYNGVLYPEDHGDIVSARTGTSGYQAGVEEYTHMDETFTDHHDNYYIESLRDQFVEDSQGSLYLEADLHKDGTHGEMYTKDGEDFMLIGGELVAEDDVLTDVLDNVFKAGDPDYLSVWVDDGSITGHTIYMHWSNPKAPSSYQLA